MVGSALKPSYSVKKCPLPPTGKGAIRNDRKSVTPEVIYSSPIVSIHLPKIEIYAFGRGRFHRVDVGCFLIPYAA